jgi:hypothetical protein
MSDSITSSPRIEDNAKTVLNAARMLSPRYFRGKVPVTALYDVLVRDPCFGLTELEAADALARLETEPESRLLGGFKTYTVARLRRSSSQA